jgi:hypothetical protein
MRNKELEDENKNLKKYIDSLKCWWHWRFRTHQLNYRYFSVSPF